MKKNAKSQKLADKELQTLTDVRAAFTASVLDLKSGAITLAESRALNKRATERLKQMQKMLEDKDFDALEPIMK